MERHDLDLTSLISGLLFVGLAILFLADRVDAIDLQVRWVWPALLIGLGVALLASGSGRRNGNGQATASGEADATAQAPDASAPE